MPDKDPRQAKSGAIINALVGKLTDEGHECSIANLDSPFRASAPDLGWLQNNINELMQKDEIKTREDIHNFIGEAVQRVKSFSNIEDGRSEFAKKEGAKPAYFVKFSTKDDFGWYDYGFYIFGKELTNE